MSQIDDYDGEKYRNGWANFEAFQQAQVNDDDFGEFHQGETTSFADHLDKEQEVESLISTCFPLISSANVFSQHKLTMLSTLPSFTTFNGATKDMTCFAPSRALWKILANIATDPIGIQYQWRKSNIEQLFHQALGVSERLTTKKLFLQRDLTPPENAPMTSIDLNSDDLPFPNSSHIDWKQNGAENSLIVDLEYYVVTSKNETNRSTPIKTIDLDPGPTAFLSEEPKAPVDSVPNFSAMNPKALMKSIGN